MTNVYTDPYQYLRAATGHDTSTVIANLTRIGTAGVLAGATSISLQAATTTALNAYDQVYIFDGAASEIVTMTPTSTSSGATSLTVSATLYAHAAGTPICTDGTGGLQGSLASMIFTASSQIEEYCRQPLLQATYSNEKLPLRTMRAAITRDYTLMIRPKCFPVQSVSAATLNIAGEATVSLNVANAHIDADAQLVQFMPLIGTGGTRAICGAPARPTTPGYVLLSYIAGYAYAELPPEIRQAAAWLTSELLSDRRNPTGAAMLKLGDMTMITPLRNDKAGRSLLSARAERALESHVQKVM